MLYKNLNVNEKGHLTIGGIDAVELAKEFGTPLYVLDEDVLRENAREYVNSLREYAPEGSMPYFASKSLSFKEIYRIIASEEMGRIWFPRRDLPPKAWALIWQKPSSTATTKPIPTLSMP